ncbi:hypothetical protein HPS36_15845 (plasmid) [Halorubrum salinarum]|uniref:Uncharacterized protein n=1 Tax=Halorubrum salinarum TaxID=2739057 RepID=A0A7D3YG74_9EURY|nr:hypothetical protein [Halorubrum salinarum]QKG94348.1 hypothetical protein HPS36_15845 [Halorubrum salinarum]
MTTGSVRSVIANSPPNFLLKETCISEDIRIFNRFNFMYKGLEPVICSFGIEVEVTAPVVEGTQR